MIGPPRTLKAAAGTLAFRRNTGNAAHVHLTAVDGHACLAKPYVADDLLRGLKIVSDIVSTGTASLPFPRGFQVLASAAGAGPHG